MHFPLRCPVPCPHSDRSGLILHVWASKVGCHAWEYVFIYRLMYYTIFHRPSSRNKVIKRPALFFRIWWCISYDHPWTINREPGELFCFWWTFLFCVYDLYQKQKLWQHAVAEPIRARVIFSIANIIVVDNYSVHLKKVKAEKTNSRQSIDEIMFPRLF